MEKLMIKFIESFGSASPHILDQHGRVLLGSHQHANYTAGEVASWPAPIAKAIVRAGFAVLVEPETP